MKHKHIKKRLEKMIALMETADHLRKGESKSCEPQISFTPIEDCVLVVYDEGPEGYDLPLPKPIVSRLMSAKQWTESSKYKVHFEQVYTDGVPIGRELRAGQKIDAPGIPELHGKVITHVHRAK